MNTFITIITPVIQVLASGIAFYGTFALARSALMFWREENYKHNINWILLEIKIPRETTRGPKAMEQFFAGIYNLANSPNGPKETFVDGEITRWYSFEIVGENQTTRLFARLPRPQRHPFESTFYAHYPDVEIVEATEDYITKYPATYQELQKQGKELYGLEIMPDPKKGHVSLPLRSYEEFENKVGDEKGRIMDTMAGVIEIIGKLKPDEVMWVQFLTIPDTKFHWLRDAEDIVEEMKASTQGGKSEGERGSKNAPDIRFRFRTQGEEKNLKRLEEKKGKAVYETFFRAIYFAPENIYNRDLPNRGLFGWMSQFASSNDKYIQKVAKNNKVRTKVDRDAFPYLYPQRRLFLKRVKIYEEYRRRFIPDEWFVGKLWNSALPLNYCFFHKPLFLSAEELATFFHVPTNVVMTATTMERIESKKLSPPSNLPGQ